MEGLFSWLHDSDLFKIIAALAVAALVMLIIYTSSVICEDCEDESLGQASEGDLRNGPAEGSLNGTSRSATEASGDSGAGGDLAGSSYRSGRSHRSHRDVERSAARRRLRDVARSAARGAPGSFDYGWIRGPHTWNVPRNNQSPINIEQRCLELSFFDTPLTWCSYDDVPLGIRLENNGHTLILRAAFPGGAPSIGGGDLLGRFDFREITFRWSWFSSNGSEHTLGNRHSALEMQCLHTDADRQQSASSQGILMISYLFDLSEDNPFLDVLVQHLVAVQQAGQTVEIPPFPLSYLMPPFHSRFYSYHGSLTEPPCHRGAEWLIQPVSLAISQRQLNEFWQLRNRQGGRIGRNARPVQPLGNRTVYVNDYRPGSSVC